VSSRVGVESAGSNFISAFNTITKLTTFQLTKSSTDAADLRLSLAFGCERQLLRLHGIHSGQSADALLVELHGTTGMRCPLG
jgi:hypothetical protein